MTISKKKNETKKGTKSTGAGSLAESAALDVVSPRQWLAEVANNEFLVDAEECIINYGSAVEIAESVKRFAMRNKNGNANEFQSAMSMLNFYINRVEKNLINNRKEVLENAKENLKQFFDEFDVNKI